MRFSLVASVLGAAALLGAGSLQAQSCTFTGPTTSCQVATTLSATVPTVARLTLTSFTSGTNTDFGSIAESDFNTGYKEVNGPKSNVKANEAWTLTVASSAANFTGAPYSKPVADLLWVNGWANTPGTAMSTTAANLATGSATNGVDHEIRYRLNLTYALDVPGTYGLTVNFTLSAP